MKTWKKFMPTALAFFLMAGLAPPAHAQQYNLEGTASPNYGKPTSVEVVQTPDGGARKNEDISKNASLIPPTFGSPTSNVLNSGSYLTPDLAPNSRAATGGAIINGSMTAVLPPSLGTMQTLLGESGSVGTPATGTIAPVGSAFPVDTSGSVGGNSNLTVEQTPMDNASSGYTDVNNDMYYEDGSLGTLVIPAIDLEVGVYQGTDATTLKKGAGHFEDSSIWDGNVAIAAHNRGANNYFGRIHTLELGDRIILTTRQGTRTYEVSSVSKVDESDRSGLTSSATNMISLYTCVRDERDFRWCVQANEIV